ncbi:MAG: hypothetical protein K0A93_13385 [Desulfuromonadaceae bacterium]|nr:hypothetical protein [Desulfuromonadaceae bacterium]
MIKRVINSALLIGTLLVAALFGLTHPATAVTISDYTAFPPFLPRVVDPNIIFLMDYSEHMVRPAYGLNTPVNNVPRTVNPTNDKTRVFFSFTDDYNPDIEYDGTFDEKSGSANGYKYECTPGGACVKTTSTDTYKVFDGNWLNWLTTTQFDLLKKATVGGNINPSPEQANPSNMTIYTTTKNTTNSSSYADIVANNPRKFYKLVKKSTCEDNAPYWLCNYYASRDTTEVPYDFWIEPTATPGVLWDNVEADNVTQNIALPFDFELYNTPFSAGQNIVVSEDGWFSFRAAADSRPNNIDLPAADETAVYNYTVAPYWTDQRLYKTNSKNSSPSKVFWFVEGEVGNRILVITYQNMVDLNDSSVKTSPLTYQAVLFEGSNHIMFNYKDVKDLPNLVSTTIDNPFDLVAGDGILDEITIYTEGSFGAGINATIGVQGANAEGYFLNQPLTAAEYESANAEDYFRNQPLTATVYEDYFTMTNPTSPYYCTQTTNAALPGYCYVESNRMYYTDFFRWRYGNRYHQQYGYNEAGGGDPFSPSGKSYLVTMATHDEAYVWMEVTPNGSMNQSTKFQRRSGRAYENKIFTYTPATEFELNKSFNAQVNIATRAVAANGNCVDADAYKNTFNGNCYDHEVSGLIQYFRENDLAGILGFRLAFMMTNASNGGKMEKHINQFESNVDASKNVAQRGAQWASLMNASRSQLPRADAPLAEALMEIQGYLREDNNFVIGNDVTIESSVPAPSKCTSNANNFDPYCFASAAQYVPCAKSFVLLVSSGHYSHDNGTSIFTPDLAATDYSSGLGSGDLTSANISNWFNGVKPTEVPNAVWTDTLAASEASKANGGWLDNVAYYGRTEDLRTDDTILPGAQNMRLYAVDTYGGKMGAGTETLKRAAHFGGFKDSLADDSIADPYTYYNPLDGNDGIKGAILRAVFDILRNSASGTSVSVLSTSAGGEGALYQAYFYPARVLNKTEERSWPGFIRAFFIDRYQNLRDDYSANASAGKRAFEPKNDRIALMKLDTGDNAVKIDFYADTDGDSIVDFTTETPVEADVAMDDAPTLWEGGEKLAKQTKSDRNIYVWLDADNDGSVDAGDFSVPDNSESFRLSTAHATTFIPYLRAQETTYNSVPTTTALQEAQNIISFITGNHVEVNNQLYRNRCVYTDDKNNAGGTLIDDPGCGREKNESGVVDNTTRGMVWPLGDIIFSTPTLVTGPSENYHKIYGDASYLAFRQMYHDRRNMVFVGANDGLLHAFNAGKYNEGDNDKTDSIDVQGYFDETPDETALATHGDIAGHNIGEELWAFLPHDLLPHLAWLTCNGTGQAASACGDDEYTHVYYLDNRPKVTDVQLFNDATTSVVGMVDGQAGVEHPHGWGTIMIVSMRLGGGAMDVSADFGSGTETRSFRSAYYVLDITNPEKPPKLLWRFGHADLGFANSYPAIVRVKTLTDSKWFAVVGSGPTNYVPTGLRDYGFSATTTTGATFAFDLQTGAVTKLDGSLFVPHQIMGDPTVIDVNQDFSADVIYIGSNIIDKSSDPPIHHGKVYRITTNRNIDPANWTVSELYSPDPSVTNVDQNNDDILDANRLGPVLVGPSASKDGNGNLWVFFGSGRLKNQNDITSKDPQTFHGIKDGCWDGELSATNTPCTTTYSIVDTNPAHRLVNTTGSAVFQLSETITAGQQVTAPANTICGTVTTCSFSDVKNNIASAAGWYKQLSVPASGGSEKVLSKSSVLGGLVLFTTYQPAADICSIFGNSNLYALYYETGTAYAKPAIGVDDTTKELLEKVSIGQGMPTSVGVAIGETVSGFIQKSTGEIITIESEPALKVKSGPSSWYRDAAECSTSRIETIYKHIAK